MNDHVHPAFRQLLDSITGDEMGFANGITQPHVFAESRVFDEFDDDLIHDVVGKRLAEPIQALLITRFQLKRILGSFGPETLDKAKMLDQVMPELDALYEGCKETWEDM